MSNFVMSDEGETDRADSLAGLKVVGAIGAADEGGRGIQGLRF